ncbi:MAG: pyridoxamine 5'-phosphate oxidase family protein [Candidatus Dormibacteria bacterium]|jgi:nitroimidazol reductase NimA-like FMN-containing flavoprotein (pyridoxamine 5'-phosphate oxidase superfamily)
MALPVARLRELSRARCLELLAGATVGRVGISMRALPVILPVTYAVAGERVIFRSAPGVKLDAAMHRLVVAFEADRYDPLGAWGWSVLVQGVASEITDAAQLAEARGRLDRDLPFLDGEVARFVTVDSTIMSGREFGPVPAR